MGKEPHPQSRKIGGTAELLVGIGWNAVLFATAEYLAQIVASSLVGGDSNRAKIVVRRLPATALADVLDDLAGSSDVPEELAHNVGRCALEFRKVAQERNAVVHATVAAEWKEIEKEIEKESEKESEEVARVRPLRGIVGLKPDRLIGPSDLWELQRRILRLIVDLGQLLIDIRDVDLPPKK